MKCYLVIRYLSYQVFYCLGGRIDHGHHDGNAVRALHDAVAMNKAVSKAADMIDQGKSNS